MPKRIQRRRTKGWRMPPNTVYVGRPSKYCNPFRRGEVFQVGGALMDDPVLAFRVLTTNEAAWPYRKEAKADLRGKDLACWCRLDQECHADVLLGIANA